MLGRYELRSKKKIVVTVTFVMCPILFKLSHAQVKLKRLSSRRLKYLCLTRKCSDAAYIFFLFYVKLIRKLPTICDTNKTSID